MPLFVAFVISLLGHASLLVVPEVDLAPTWQEQKVIIKAELIPPKERPREAVSEGAIARTEVESKAKPAPKQSIPKPVSRKPKAAPAKRKTPIALQAADDRLAIAEAASLLSAPEAFEALVPVEIEPDSGSAVPSSRLPLKGRIVYAVNLGTRNFMVGRAVHQWEMGNGRYYLHNKTESRGLAAVFYGGSVEQESEGRLGPNGMIPEQLHTIRNGKPTNESAEFDWHSNTLHMGHDGGQKHRLQPGTQDLTTVTYQLGYYPLEKLRRGFTLHVATGKKYEAYSIQMQGEETLSLPIGEVRALHLKVPGDSVTEIWLAIDKLMLPVKVRFTSKDGHTFEQIAQELVLGQ